MKWFEQAPNGGLARARFAEVGPTQKRPPSWVPGRNAFAANRHEGTSLRPPKLPSEFVDAVRHELDPEYAGRARQSLPVESSLRRSERVGASLPPASAPLHPPIVVEPGFAAPPAPDPALVEGFENALRLLALEREQLLTETAKQVAELAALIARRVIGRELSLDPMLVHGLVREGIEALGQHDRVLVRLGSAFGSTRDALEQKLQHESGRIEVRIDASLEDWGCVVDTELGLVDESVERRLETLLQALKPESSPP